MDAGAGSGVGGSAPPEDAARDWTRRRRALVGEVACRRRVLERSDVAVEDLNAMILLMAPRWLRPCGKMTEVGWGVGERRCGGK
jgi:hypothetical protein